MFSKTRRPSIQCHRRGHGRIGAGISIHHRCDWNCGDSGVDRHRTQQMSAMQVGCADDYIDVDRRAAKVGTIGVLVAIADEAHLSMTHAKPGSMLVQLILGY